MDIKNIKIIKNGKRTVEKFVVTKPLTTYGWDVVETATGLFYEYQKMPSMLAVEKFVRNCNFDRYKELVLEPSMLIHFSTGLTNVKTVKSILSDGLKCYEANISKYKKYYKAKDESNYVVDTWSFNSNILYSDFAKDTPKFNNIIDMDRADLEKKYAPAPNVADFTANYLNDIKNGLIFDFDSLTDEQKRDIECRALQNIGFIVNFNAMPEDLKNFDIYANRTMQKEFCGDSFLRTSNMKGCYSVRKNVNDKVYNFGNYGVTSFVYGIPGEYIVGVIATFGLLYSDEICKELFYNGMSNRFIVSPIGTLLYSPNYKLTTEENFAEFIRRKDEFLAENDKEYKLYVVTKNIVDYHIKPWKMQSSAPSNRYEFNMENKEDIKEDDNNINDISESGTKEENKLLDDDTM